MDEETYIKTLSNDELKTLEIARNHLGDSFDMEKVLDLLNIKSYLLLLDFLRTRLLDFLRLLRLLLLMDLDFIPPPLLLTKGG